jgi:hypothetical protein
MGYGGGGEPYYPQYQGQAPYGRLGMEGGGLGVRSESPSRRIGYEYRSESPGKRLQYR